MGMGVSSGICRSSPVVCMRLVLVTVVVGWYYIINGHPRLVTTCVAVICPVDHRSGRCHHRKTYHRGEPHFHILAQWPFGNGVPRTLLVLRVKRTPYSRSPGFSNMYNPRRTGILRSAAAAVRLLWTGSPFHHTFPQSYSLTLHTREYQNIAKVFYVLLSFY